MRALTPLIFLLIFGGVFLCESSFAEVPKPCPNPSVNEVKETLKMGRSSAEIPTPLKKPEELIRLECERPFVYNKEVYPTDSPQKQDASNLKYFVSENAEATRLLTAYQEHRRAATFSAYTGSVGLGLIILANLVGRRVLSPEAQTTLIPAMQVTGASLTVWGFMNSFLILRGNETTIPKAVDAYNRGSPTNPIELRFETGWRF